MPNLILWQQQYPVSVRIRNKVKDVKHKIKTARPADWQTQI